MRIRRRLPILFGVVLVVAAVAIAVLLRKHAPPEPARLLPGADAFFYVNLKWVRRVNVAGQLPDVSHDPEYEQFIQETGFLFERDLDQVAFAVHYPPGPTTGRARPGGARYSEVFVGKIDGQRLRTYLHKIATAVENYRSTDIYSVPVEDHVLRVAVLTVDTVAASNHPDPQVVRGIVDRSRKLASPFGGPALLRQYYKQVPLASLCWSIARVDPSSAVTSAPVDLSFLFDKPAVVVASARYLGSLHLKAEAFTASDDDARQVSEKLNTFLGIFHSAEVSVHGQGSDADVKGFFDSLKVQQQNDRAVLTAVLPPGFLKKAVEGAPKELAPEGTTGPRALPSPPPQHRQVQ